MSRSYYGVKSGARIPHPVAPSAWNPLDLITAQALPSIIGLTEGTRLATRNTVLPDHWEGGVRGVQARGGVAAERWYLELEVVSVGSSGDPSFNQGMQFGLTNNRATNILSRPPTSNSSEVTNLILPAAEYLLQYTRTDGVIFASTGATPPTQVATFGSQPAVGDIFGFDWIVGTSITVTRNGASPKVIAYTSTTMLYPYFSAGVTLVDATNKGTSEACRIRTGASQQSFKPSGATSWG